MQNDFTLKMTRSGIRSILCCIILLSVFLLPGTLAAEEIIKVVMLEKPDDPLPSSKAEKVGDFAGKVLINGKFHSGSLEVLQDRGGLYVIKKFPLEEYIEGVLVSETRKEWELEALKARAVISRTNTALYRANNTDSRYHLPSTLPDLLYRGKNTDPLVSRAVRATEGEILTYNGLPIKALFYFADLDKEKLPSKSREGVLNMAREGKDYKEILEHYYPGTVIKKQEEIVASSQ